MRSQRVALLIRLNFFACLIPSDATWFRGKKWVPANSAVFIAKYCFDFDPKVKMSTPNTSSGPGEVDFLMKRIDPAKGLMKVVLLDDQGDSYPDSSGQWPGFDCGDERLQAVAKSQWEVQAKSLPRNNKFHTWIVESLRPRFWFVAILDCSGIARTIEYDLHMLNSEQGWLAELPMDRCGAASLCSFFVAYLSLGIVQVRALTLAGEAKTKHPLRLLLTFGLSAALWNIVFSSFGTIWHAYRGEDEFWLYLAGKLFKAWSKFTLFMILVLLSRGRCISHALRFRDIWHGAMTVAPFLILCLGLEIWGELDQSRKYTTNWVYVTWVGGVLVLVDFALLWLYVWNLLRSSRDEPEAEKKSFYRTWGFVYCSAFLSLPVSVLVAAVVAPHVRVEVMFILNNSIHLLLLGLLVIGLYPNRTQKAFCIDRAPELACTFGNQVDSLLEEELKARGGDYQEFNVEGSALVTGNG